MDKSQTPIWNRVESSDIGNYKLYLKDFFTVESKINTKIFGFIDKDNKKNIIFKTRTTGDKQRNISGFNCNTAGKNDVIKKIKDLPIPFDLNYDSIKKQGICVIFELIFRKLDEEMFDGKRWLFDKVLRNKSGDVFIGKVKP